MRPLITSATLAAVTTLCSLMLASATAAGVPALIRQQKMVMVDGKPEIWRLQWEAKPTPACGVEEAEVSLTCPCSGFAYGEKGPLALIRLRSDGATERLELGPMFDDGYPANGTGTGVRLAVVQRWAPIETTGPDNDWQHMNDQDFVAQVARRPEIDVMRFADFNHDGQATEFLLQVGTLPCGKHQMVVVGVSKTNPHLHVFSSQEKPDKPLILSSWEWEALRDRSGPIEVIDWICDDHGSEVEWRVRLSAESGVIHASKTSDYCPSLKQSPVYPELLNLTELYKQSKLSQQDFEDRQQKLLMKAINLP